MKKFFSMLAVCFLMVMSSNVYAQWGSGSGSLSNDSKQEIKWEKSTIDLGNIKYGTDTEVVFKLTNTAGRPILITNAEGSCGCTKINYPHKPIIPNQTVEVTVTYEADDVGVFNKTVNLTLNIQNSRQTLHIKGVVKN